MTLCDLARNAATQFSEHAARASRRVQSLLQVLHVPSLAQGLQHPQAVGRAGLHSDLARFVPVALHVPEPLMLQEQ
jgi:hypothetical protein